MSYDTSKVIGFGKKHIGSEISGEYIDLAIEINGEMIYLVLFSNKQKHSYQDPDFNVFHSRKFRELSAK